MHAQRLLAAALLVALALPVALATTTVYPTDFESTSGSWEAQSAWAGDTLFVSESSTVNGVPVHHLHEYHGAGQTLRASHQIKHPVEAIAATKDWMAYAVFYPGDTPMVETWHRGTSGWAYWSTLQWPGGSPPSGVQDIALAMDEDRLVVAYLHKGLWSAGDAVVMQYDFTPNGYVSYLPVGNFKVDWGQRLRPTGVTAQGNVVALGLTDPYQGKHAAFSWHWQGARYGGVETVPVPSKASWAFGTAVHVRPDPANLLMVGDPHYHNHTGTPVGRVWRYEWVPSKTHWVSVTPLEHPEDVPGGLGNDIASTWHNGAWNVLVGSMNETYASLAGSGAVYMFNGHQIQHRWWICDPHGWERLGHRVFVLSGPMSHNAYHGMDPMAMGAEYDPPARTEAWGVYTLGMGTTPCNNAVGTPPGGGQGGGAGNGTGGGSGNGNGGGSGNGTGNGGAGNGTGGGAGNGNGGGSGNGTGNGGGSGNGTGSGNGGGNGGGSGNGNGNGGSNGGNGGGGCTDCDGDGVQDAGDNCPGIANRDQSDRDRDGVGDACDDDMWDNDAGNHDDLVEDEGNTTVAGVDVDRRAFVDTESRYSHIQEIWSGAEVSAADGTVEADVDAWGGAGTNHAYGGARAEAKAGPITLVLLGLAGAAPFCLAVGYAVGKWLKVG